MKCSSCSISIFECYKYDCRETFSIGEEIVCVYLPTAKKHFHLQKWCFSVHITKSAVHTTVME